MGQAHKRLTKDREEELRHECCEKCVLFYPFVIKELFDELDATREELQELRTQTQQTQLR